MSKSELKRHLEVTRPKQEVTSPLHHSTNEEDFNSGFELEFSYDDYILQDTPEIVGSMSITSRNSILAEYENWNEVIPLLYCKMIEREDESSVKCLICQR